MPTGPYDCPCGAHVTDPNSLATYVTDTLIDAVLDGVTGAVKWLGVLAPFSGTLLDVQTICASPKARQPSWSLSDVLNPGLAGLKAAEMLRAKVYELLCTCDDCPPVTNCGAGGTVIEVGPSDGFYPDPGQPGVVEYLIPAGVEVWAERVADSYCIGQYSGVDIVWHIDDIFDPTHATSIHNRNGGGGFSWSQDVLAGDYRLYVGGTPLPPEEPVPAPPTGLADWYGPPTCTNDDICASLGVTEERIRRIEYLVDFLTGLAVGTTNPVSVTIPGINAPITGGWPAVIGNLITAIAPIAPSQLVNPATTTITATSFISTTGLAYVNLVPTVIPEYMGSTGVDDTKFYFHRANNPGPGYAMIIGQEGVLAQYLIRSPSGCEFPIPSTATGIAVSVPAGVEIEVHTWEREL